MQLLSFIVILLNHSSVEGRLPDYLTKADGTDYLSMRFQFWRMAEDSRVRIILTGSSVRVCLVVLNQGCCGFGQYNLPDRMLRLDPNTSVNQTYVLFINLVHITYQRGNKYLLSTHYLDSSPWQVLYIPLLLIFFFSFLPAIVLNCFSCSAYILQMHINLASFLFKSNFNSFQTCDSAHLLNHCYYCYNYYFYYYLLLVFFLHVLF